MAAPYPPDELTLETTVMDKARKGRHVLMPKVFRKTSLYEGHKKKSVMLIWGSPVVDEGDLVELFKKDRDQEEVAIESIQAVPRSEYAVLAPVFIWLYGESFTRGMSAYLDEKESRNIKKAVSNERGAEIEPNTIENENNDEPLGEISDDDEESSNEQSENEGGKLTAPIELLGGIAVLIYEPENTEAKQFFPLLEEKLLMEEAQKIASGESEDDEDTGDESSDNNTKSTSCSNSNDEENEESSDDSEEN